MVISFNLMAVEKISDYKYYQSDNFEYGEKKISYIAYIKTDDPCIYIKDIKMDNTTRFCKMGNSNIDLENDSVSVYPVRLSLFGGYLKFTIAAPWDEQKCQIDLYKKSINCESTGK